MTRSEVRDFIESGVTLLNEAGTYLEFGNGRVTELNSNRSNTYPKVWLDPLTVSTDLVNSMPFDNWDIVLRIAGKDAQDSKPEQYEAIVDTCDEIAQKLVKKYNDVASGYKLVTISGITREPFIKKQADNTSGVILSFTLTSPDSTNLC